MPRAVPPIRALFLDLDNTLFPTRAVPRETVQPVLDAITRANERVGALDEQKLAAVLDDCWRFAFDAVVRRHGLPPEISEAMHAASRQLRVDVPLEPYPDVEVIGRLPLLRFLVTTGHRVLQESKVAALRIADYFDAIYIDDLSEPGPPGKGSLFAGILKAHDLAPREVLVIGDSAESEIAAGNRLGIPTVQILRPGVEPCAAASFRLASLHELPPLIARLSAE